MDIQNIPSFEKELINVIIETPRNSVYKYDFNPEYTMFRLNKIMPLGMAFPFDFGFIPGTKGEDGDPLDVLVLMDQPAIQGVLIECRSVALLQANQREHDGKEVRNDRIVAIANHTILYKSILNLGDLNKDLTTGIENFFIQYNQLAGKEFTPLGWVDKTTAVKLIKDSVITSK